MAALNSMLGLEAPSAIKATVFGFAASAMTLGYGLGRVFWRSAQERHRDAPRLMLSTQGVAFQWDLR